MRKYRRFVENLKDSDVGAAIWVCATHARGDFLRRRRPSRSGIWATWFPHSKRRRHHPVTQWRGFFADSEWEGLTKPAFLPSAN